MSQTPTPVTDALRQSGGFNPAWEAMEKLDPAFLESFLAMGMQPRHLTQVHLHSYLNQ